MAGRASAEAQTRPNILLVFPDQHRFDWVPWNKAVPVRTPHLAALAARGMRFDAAVTPSPLCAPARACLASGREYDRCGVPSNGENYPLDQVTVYALLRDAGYQVAGCGKFDLHKASRNWGTDGKHLLKEWGFTGGCDSAGKWDAVAGGADEPKDPFTAMLKDRGLLAAHVADMQRRRKDRMATFATPLPDDAYGDNFVGQKGLDLLRGFERGRPWMLQVNFPGPHEPWDITARMEAECRGLTGFPPPAGRGNLAPEHLAVRQNYTAMIENIDRWLGRYVEALRERGELDRTIVIWSSDHGEMLGDRDAWSKSKPWQPSIGVPLVVAGPGVREGASHAGPATTLDLAATFVDYAGATVPPDWDSRSLRPVLEGRAERHREVVLSGLGPWRVVWDGRWKLIRRSAGAGAKAKAAAKASAKAAAEPPVELYDLKADPHEQADVAAAHPDVVERLSRHLPSGASA
jgi:arylsulfatase A-like enzyme